MGTAHIDEGLATFYRYGPYLDHEAVDAVDDLVDTGDYELADEFVKVRIDADAMVLDIVVDSPYVALSDKFLADLGFESAQVVACGTSCLAKMRRSRLA